MEQTVARPAPESLPVDVRVLLREAYFEAWNARDAIAVAAGQPSIPLQAPAGSTS